MKYVIVEVIDVAIGRHLIVMCIITQKMTDISTVREFVIKTLPNLSSQQLDAVMNKLVELGVDELDYLQYVEGKHLEFLLKPVHIAKLLAMARNAGNYVYIFNQQFFCSFLKN